MSLFREAFRAQKGFTLIEVLIAMAILSTVIGAMMILMAQQGRTLTIIEQRAFANIVAENILTETMAQIEQPEIANSEGQMEIAGRIWNWRQEIADTGNRGVLQIRVVVIDDRTKQEITSLIAFRSPA